MRRMLLVAVTCLSFGHVPGEAQSSDTRYGTFADTGRIACVSWNRPRAPGGKFSSERFFLEATRYAWVYGFVVGASYTSEDRLARIDAASVDAWMDKYCDDHPRATLATAVATLIDELTKRP